MRASNNSFRAIMKAVGTALLSQRSQWRGAAAPVASPAARESTATRLGKSVQPLAQAHPRKSGVVALQDGSDAFAVRVGLADAAEHTLDAQYYIWHDDMSGTLLFEALHRAADRGVRVRLLLDDNNTVGLDPLLAALNAHPNIEVRLFNPFTHRRWRALNYLTDFARLNRRMHNKSFTVDDQITIVGGRNVGDEYFDAGHNALYVDLDVMAIGPVVNDVSKDFDRYWASGSAHPAERFLPAVDAATITALEDAASHVARDPDALAYTHALSRQPFVRDLLAGRLSFEWAVIRLISDDPAKGLNQATDDRLLWPRLRRMIGHPEHELELISPYFVPTAAGVKLFGELAERGVKVTILTNSLEATDVAVVHAGYAKRRKPLLKSGITLFEMKRASSPPPVKDRGLTGDSGSSLHAKTFSADRSRVFVGSFNFDPRSLQLNTEMGLVIESETMAQDIAEIFGGSLPARAYQVRLGDAGALQWTEQRDGKEIVHDREPNTSLWRSAAIAAIAMLPIEWLL